MLIVFILKAYWCPRRFPYHMMFVLLKS